jgi:hypothetical protein
MLEFLPSKVVRYFIALFGCTYLSACTTTGTQQVRLAQTPDASYSIAVASPPNQEVETDPDAKLNNKFLEKIEQVLDPDLQVSYTQGIHILHRLAQREPKNREILEKLVQHQEQTLDIFQICNDKEKFSKSFDWLTLYHSQFWKRADGTYLVLLICSTGTSNRRFVTFLYSESNGEARFKPLKLTQFLKKDGAVQRFESELGVGRPFPNNGQWFNPKTEELRIWRRLGGGAEACGIKGIYRLQNDEFVVEEFTARFECNPTQKGEYERIS